MKNVWLAFRSLFSKGQNNTIKILSLGVGLAVGLVLVTKIYFEQSFDDFYPDVDRIYQIHQQGKTEDGVQTHGTVSGGVADGLREEIPEVEYSTRFTYLIRNDMVFFTPDKKRYVAPYGVILGDSNIFDILPRPMLVGDPKEALSIPMHVLISRSVAEKMGFARDVVGQSFFLDRYPGRELKIGGVFEDIPENSHLRYDIIISMPSISNFMWDGSNNYLGNDRYYAYLKLKPNTNWENLTPAIRRMQEKKHDQELLRRAGVEINYILSPLDGLYKNMPETKRMTILLALLAFAIIFTAIMNYILIAISSLVSRTREVAIHKCYGAGENNIASKMLSETFVHLLLSLVISAALIILFRNTIQELLSASISSLFTWRSFLLLLLVCFVVFLITGFIPAKLYSKIPVSSAFRSSRESRRIWKLALLFLQFTATIFLVTLLVIIGRQYNKMVNDNPGYEYENVLYTNVGGVTGANRQKAVDELRRLSEVEQVAACDVLPIFGSSGNNVSIPGEDEELFNMVDLYGIDNEYLSLMKIPLLEGVGFEKGVTTIPQMVVSKSFSDKVAQRAGWSDGVIGKNVYVSEHGNCLITGVYPDIRISSIIDPENRPSAMFYSDSIPRHIMIKLYDLKSENIQKVITVLENSLPDKDIVVIPYKSSVVNEYNSSRLFRNAVMIGGLVTLIIALIGLIGYTNDEVNRKRSEIAIRKVNGASIFEIQQLFVKDILKIALPALLIGSIASVFTANKWMESFSEKASMPVWLFIICAIGVLSVILSVVLTNTYRAATKNPADTINNNQ